MIQGANKLPDRRLNPHVKRVLSLSTAPASTREAAFLAEANRRIAAYSTAMRDLRSGVQFLIQANDTLSAGKALSSDDAGRLRTIGIELLDAEAILYG